MFLQQGNCLIHVTAADGKADILGFIPSDGLQDDVNIDILLPQQGEDLVGDSGLIFHPHQRQTGYVLVFCHTTDLGLFHLLRNLLDFRARLFLKAGQHFQIHLILFCQFHRTVMEHLRTQGKASVLLAEGARCLGILAMSDVLRPEAKAMVEQLAAMHVSTVLLTGDSQAAAHYFASRTGISTVRAQLLPGEKVSCITQLQEAGQSVCMIGDGVNDAPALKTASVGVAMGSMGSDIAVEAADIALMNDDISKIPYLKRLSNATVKTIRLSISMSMLINLIAVTLSVLGLLNPTTGALVHNAGSCFVVLIAALLYDRKFQ